MLLVELINWWYGRGFKAFFLKLIDKLRNTADFFSIGSLVKTWFLPFRQISAGSVEGSLETRFQAFLDRLVSRAVGFTLRTLLIILGLISLILQSAISIVAMIAYPFMPIMPICCIVLWTSGVTL
ncbi:hypothetical protein IJ765_00840 [Candidatus Saccharibacteria bacterium]|nr:hypothetical protein [Candidatus Saccharibacteria bacterium]